MLPPLFLPFPNVSYIVGCYYRTASFTVYMAFYSLSSRSIMNSWHFYLEHSIRTGAFGKHDIPSLVACGFLVLKLKISIPQKNKHT